METDTRDHSKAGTALPRTKLGGSPRTSAIGESDTLFWSHRHIYMHNEE